MKIRIAVIAVVLVLIVTVLILRAPRIKPGMVLITKCQQTEDSLVIEYRMEEPFELVLEHWQHEPLVRSDGTGVTVGTYQNLRTESVAKVKSKYSLLRGEHYVTLALERGRLLFYVKANGLIHEVVPWSNEPASKARLLPRHIRGDHLGNYVGIKQVEFAADSGVEESLVVYAGTPVEDPEEWEDVKPLNQSVMYFDGHVEYDQAAVTAHCKSFVGKSEAEVREYYLLRSPEEANDRQRKYNANVEGMNFFWIGPWAKGLEFEDGKVKAFHTWEEKPEPADATP